MPPDDRPRFIIDGESVHTETFRVPIPDGWRVISGEAAQPITIILAAPEACALMVVSVDPAVVLPQAVTCAELEVEQRRYRVERGEGEITLLAAAQSDRWLDVEPLVERARRALAGG